MLPSPFRYAALAKLPFANKLATIAALMCLCVSLVLVSINQYSLRSINSTTLNLLGNQLSQQLALNARPALIQNDTLSLQSLLLEIIDSPAVIQAIIYDAENKPVAEAGSQATGVAYTAIINYQDSIAGHSLVILDATLLTRQTTVLLLQQLVLSVFLAICVYMLSLWLGGLLSSYLVRLRALIKSPNYPANTRRQQFAYDANDELSDLITQILQGPDTAPTPTTNHEIALLHIKVHFPSHHEFDQAATLPKLQQQLSNICKLYDGQVELSRPNSFTAVFQQQVNNNEHPFRALCCAKIIEKLYRDNSDQIAITTTLMLLGHNDIFSKQSAIELAHQNGDLTTSLTLDPPILSHPSIQGRLDSQQFAEASAIEFVSAYNDLIERQLAALQWQFNKKAS